MTPLAEVLHEARQSILGLEVISVSGPGVQLSALISSLGGNTGRMGAPHQPDLGYIFKSALAVVQTCFVVDSQALTQSSAGHISRCKRLCPSATFEGHQ